jgi:hypothetical protein
MADSRISTFCGGFDSRRHDVGWANASLIPLEIGN